MIVGHEATLKALKAELPPVTLLMGPESTGKFLVAETALQDHGYKGSNLLSVRQLNMEMVRELKSQTVLRGSKRAFAIDIDQTTARALNSLLKTLEEPAPNMRIILTASKRPLLTIISRSFVFRTGLLSNIELQEILTARYGLNKEIAERAAYAGRGQVRPALAYVEIENAKTPVLTLTRSVASGDLATFMATASTWSADNQALLITWARELLTDHFSVFSPAESFGFNQRTLGQRRQTFEILTSALRPRLAVKQAFLPMFP